MKRSRSSTINICLKSSTALRSITEKPREYGISDGTATSRKMDTNLALRSVPSFSTIGKGQVLASPKSPRSPLSQHTLQAYFDSSSSPENQDFACILKQSSSFGTLLLPSTLSNAPSDLSLAMTPSTALTPSHTVYIDHITVSYNPATISGQECKKLLMRLERFKKRSSIDSGTLSSEQVSQNLATFDNANGTATTEGTKRKVSASKPGSAKIPISYSAGNATVSSLTGSGDSPSAIASSAGNAQTFRVLAKIRDHNEANKIEVKPFLIRLSCISTDEATSPPIYLFRR